MREVDLLGVTDGFALFGNDAGLTVVVNLSNLAVYDPIPKLSVDFGRWGAADPAVVQTEAYELAQDALSTAVRIEGTDVLVAAGTKDKRSFAIPKAAQAEAQKALKWHAEHHRGGTDVGMNTARTLAKGGSVGIAKVRHIARALSRMMQTWNELTALDAVNPSRTMSPTVVPAEMLALMLTHDARYAALQTSEKDAGGHQRGSATTASAHGAQQRDDSGAQTTQTANSQRTSAQDFEPPKSATRTLNTENALSVTTGSDASTGSQPTPTTAWKQRSVGAAGSANARATSGADSQLTTTRTREKFADFYARRATSLSDNFSTTEQFWSELSSTSPLLTERLAELRIAWALWGGDPAWKWASAIAKREQDLAMLVELAATPALPSEPEPDAELAPEPAVAAIDPDEPHDYVPDPDNDYLCEICGNDEEVLIHTPSFVPPGVLAASGSKGTRRIVSADEFYSFVTDDTDDYAMYITYDTRADGSPSMVTGLYLVRGENVEWMEWSPSGHKWSSTAEPAFFEPIDEESAYELAILFDSTGKDEVPARMLNEVEWGMVEPVLPFIPEHADALLEDVEFCVVMGTRKDIDGVLILEVYARTQDGDCWRWNPVDVEWIPASKCPDDCTVTDMETARDAAARLMSEAHSQAVPSRGQRFHGLPEANPRLGPKLPNNPNRFQRVPNRHTTPYEFDSAFSRAAWVRNTGGGFKDGPPAFSPGATATSFSMMELDTTPGVYTPEERSQNASRQPRDSLGRFTQNGSVVHIKGSNRTGQVRKYNPDRNTFDVQYSDGAVQEVDARNTVRIGDGQVQKKFDASKILAEPRAVATTPKAMLPKLLVPMDRDALNKVMTDYQAFIEEERRRGVEKFSLLTPETSDVKPLYLAEVDELDKQAVLELYALVPKTKTTSEVMLYRRDMGGWVRDDRALQKLRSTTPPPIVTLDDATYKVVIEQVDSYFTEKKSKQASEASVGDADVSTEVILASMSARRDMVLWDEDGNLIPAFEADALVAAGVPGVADTPSDVAAARKLRNYWLRGRGAAKIRWNTPGDWTRCVRHLSKYMGPRAKGYCADLHKDATGMYTGDKLHRDMYGWGDKKRLSSPTVVLADTSEVTSDTQFLALLEVEVPSVDDMERLTTRDAGHRLRVGERFLVDGGDGVYAVRVLEPTSVLGWESDPAVLVSGGQYAFLLQEA